MKQRNILKTIALVATAALAGSCGGHDIASFRAMPQGRWAYADTVVLTPALPDTAMTGALLLSVRHDNSYPFANMWVEVTVDSVLRDTVEIRLADVYGNWHGRASGVSVSLTDTLAQHISLRQGSTVTVRHIMRPDTLRGVERIGLIFSPEDNAKD